MRITTTLAAAATLALSATSAFAWGDMYMGDGTHNPNADFLMNSYHAPNHCPAGPHSVCRSK
ncbi:MAG: hypothetical protein QNJ09_17570 [Paracoccaceae bacterium]|nr:hypothetical protein [Paracoccaceae bacterium]